VLTRIGFSSLPSSYSFRAGIDFSGHKALCPLALISLTLQSLRPNGQLFHLAILTYLYKNDAKYFSSIRAMYSMHYTLFLINVPHSILYNTLLKTALAFCQIIDSSSNVGKDSRRWPIRDGECMYSPSLIGHLLPELFYTKTSLLVSRERCRSNISSTEKTQKMAFRYLLLHHLSNATKALRGCSFTERVKTSGRA